MYLDADKFALGIKHKYPIPFIDTVWRYERWLRFYEYHANVGHRCRRKFYAFLLTRLGERLGFSISGNCFGPGLRINHYGLLIVNAKAKIGKWCDIHQGVNIGENGYMEGDGTIVHQVPCIGDFCFIGPGAKIFGKCTVGNNARIGANAVICKDIADNQTAISSWGGVKTHDNKRNIITIASKDVEQTFLSLYPQYKDML